MKNFHCDKNIFVIKFKNNFIVDVVDNLNGETLSVYTYKDRESVLFKINGRLTTFINMTYIEFINFLNIMKNIKYDGNKRILFTSMNKYKLY